MFFDSLDDIRKISGRNNCSIFVLPDEVGFELKNALLVEPDGKIMITVEQVRVVISKVSAKQINDLFVIIRPADKMTDVAANAFLKSLEEPKEKIHYILITSNPSKLLPTILSRAMVYFFKTKWDERELKCNVSMKELAKQLIAAKPSELISLSEKLLSKKDNARAYVLDVVGLAIEMLYKSYFVTNKVIFLSKLPKFLELYQNIEQNGHLKLHLVADLC